MLVKGSLIAQGRKHFKPAGFPIVGVQETQQAQLWLGRVWKKPHPLTAGDRIQHCTQLSPDFPSTGWREKKRSKFVLHNNSID